MRYQAAEREKIHVEINHIIMKDCDDDLDDNDVNDVIDMISA